MTEEGSAISISDEHDLTERLDQAFQTITPCPAPVERTVRQGTMLRARRRGAALTGLAAAAAAAVAVPVLHHQTAQPTLNQPRHSRVTVQPAGPHAPTGLIASGAVDGKRWQITLEKPGTGGARPGTQCAKTISVQDCGPVIRASRSDPVQFLGASAGPVSVAYGPVSAAVGYVTVRLAGGTALTLHPVSVYGTRYVAFAVPLHLAISRVTAYSAHGELATAVPFNAPSGSATVSQWLRPGQLGQRRATHIVGSGTAAGGAWSVTAYVGPWGDCLVTRHGGSCGQVPSAPGTSIMGSVSGPPLVRYGSASANVEHVVVTLASGGTIRVRAVSVGDQKFFAFGVGRGQSAVRWRAYDAARHQVASGRLSGLVG